MAHASDVERIMVELTVAEALTVVAALRQYMPYWPSNEDAAGVAARLESIRHDITSTTTKIRAAAAQTA